MTTPNKFESAARLQRALDKLAEKRAAKLDAVCAQYDERREAILAAADPEARGLVLSEEPKLATEVPCDSCENMHAPPVCPDPDPLPAIGGVEVDRATGRTRRV